MKSSKTEQTETPVHRSSPVLENGQLADTCNGMLCSHRDL